MNVKQIRLTVITPLHVRTPWDLLAVDVPLDTLEMASRVPVSL